MVSEYFFRTEKNNIMAQNDLDTYKQIIEHLLESPIKDEKTLYELKYDKIDINIAFQIVYRYINMCTGKPVVDKFDMDKDGSIIIVGDIHGQLSSLLELVRIHGINANYLFMGDYIDRGPNSLYCILVVYMLKIINPKNILLRGNHEADCINSHDDLYFSIAYNYTDTIEIDFNTGNYEWDWKKCTHEEHSECRNLRVLVRKSFNYLSTCAIINNECFCSHAGIATDLDFLMRISQMVKPVVLPERTSEDADVTVEIKQMVEPAINDTLELFWNDYAGDDFDEDVMKTDNTIRGRNYLYTKKCVNAFLEKYGYRGIIHGHDPVNGYRTDMDGNIMTLNSNFLGPCKRAYFRYSKGSMEVRFF